MSWKTEWKAVSARITSLLDAGHFFAEILKVYASDAYGGGQVLTSSAAETFNSLDTFSQRHSGSLPQPAAQRLRDFLEGFRSKFESPPTGRDAQFQCVQFRLTALRVLQSEIGYLLSDAEIVGRSLVERAFLHLQRLIVADDGIRATWQAAFQKGEPACERLGGAHLLLHGIWAFKANAEGERTDLVLGQRLRIDSEVERAAEALVLTEWKRLRDGRELTEKAEQAFTQARLYASGSMAGFELTSRRYLVLVSKTRIDVPAERVHSNVTYQFVNVPVEPVAPSVEARES